MRSKLMPGSSVGFINLTLEEILSDFDTYGDLSFGELERRGYLRAPVHLDTFAEQLYDCGIFNQLPDTIQHTIVSVFLLESLEDMLD